MLTGFSGGKAEKEMTLNSLHYEYNLSITLPFLYLRGGWRKITGASLLEYIVTYFWKIV